MALALGTVNPGPQRIAQRAQVVQVVREEMTHAGSHARSKHLEQEQRTSSSKRVQNLFPHRIRTNTCSYEVTRDLTKR
jgi:hypothetical protein